MRANHLAATILRIVKKIQLVDTQEEKGLLFNA